MDTLESGIKVHINSLKKIIPLYINISNIFLEK